MTKTAKKTGPIRTGFVIPFTIVVVATGVYFKLFFDSNIRNALEFIGTRVHGAEVNVGSVATSFIAGTFTLNDLQITDSEAPANNTLQIGRMHFGFSWDAVLRAKFVVNDASIDNFQINIPRKKPGRVLPKDVPEAATSGENKPGDSDASSTGLADAAKLLEGADPLKDLKDIGNLESLAQIEKLKAELPVKQKEWNQTLESLKANKDVQDLKTKIQNFKVGGANDPASIQKQISEADSLIKQTNETLSKVKTQSDTLTKSVSDFAAALKEVETLIQKDRANVQAKLKLPTLDMKSIALQLFGASFRSKLGQAQKYIGLAEKYMPPKKSKDEKDIPKPQARATGVTIPFPITTGYPLFWLKRAALSSKAAGSPFGGDLEGELTHVSSDPSVTQKPTVLKLAGDFPAQEITDFSLEITFDHTKDVGVDTLKSSVGSYAIKNMMLSQSESLQFGFKEAVGHATFTGRHSAGELKFDANTTFEKISYDVGSKTEQLDQILKGAVADIPKVTVDAEARGRLSDLQTEIKSNLAGALQAGIEKQLKAKMDEAKQKIQALIDEKIGSQKKDLEAQYGASANSVKAQVESYQKEADKLKGMGDAKLNEAKSQVTKQLPKNLNDLKKGLGF